MSQYDCMDAGGRATHGAVAEKGGGKCGLKDIRVVSGLGCKLSTKKNSLVD
jgi:hypothetical protein